MNNLRVADDTIHMEEREEELKSLVLKVKKENEKHWLKAEHSEKEDHGIRSHHFMANRWGNNGNNTDFIFLGPRITTDGNCNHEIKDTFSLEAKL